MLSRRERHDNNSGVIEEGCNKEWHAAKEQGLNDFPFCLTVHAQFLKLHIVYWEIANINH
jgi:hypothetical protein